MHVVFNGVMLGILLFVGFEAAASIGEESHDPTRSIPRALLWTVALGGVLRLHGLRDLDRPRPEDGRGGRLGFDPAALDKVATEYVSSRFATMIDLVVILDATALALAICVTIGRGYFALGRDGLLPSVFAKTSRHNTPWVGNLVVAVGGIGLTLVGLYSHTMTASSARGPPLASSRPSSWRRRPARSRSSSSTCSWRWRRSRS